MSAYAPEKRPDTPCGCAHCGWRGTMNLARMQGFHAFCPRCGQLVRALPTERKGYVTKHA